MEISNDGFKTVIGSDGKIALLFDSERATECVKFAIEKNIRTLSLYPGVYLASNLFPLFEIKDFISGLLLEESIDYSGLNYFKNLTYLSIPDNKKDSIDLSIFSDIEVLACDFSDRLKGLESAIKLRSLTISNFKSKNNNLSEIPALLSLEHLNLIKPRINSLQGIEKFTKLKRLEIYGASKLDRIGDVSNLKSLEQICIEKSKAINDFEALKDLTSLKKLMLTESGNIKTLSFLKMLPNLKFISLWRTNVLDGDLSYCEGIDYVGFDNKRHYSHKSEEFKK